MTLLDATFNSVTEQSAPFEARTKNMLARDQVLRRKIQQDLKDRNARLGLRRPPLPPKLVIVGDPAPIAPAPAVTEDGNAESGIDCHPLPPKFVVVGKPAAAASAPTVVTRRTIVATRQLATERWVKPSPARIQTPPAGLSSARFLTATLSPANLPDATKPNRRLHGRRRQPATTASILPSRSSLPDNPGRFENPLMNIEKQYLTSRYGGTGSWMSGLYVVPGSCYYQDGSRDENGIRTGNSSGSYAARSGDIAVVVRHSTGPKKDSGSVNTQSPAMKETGSSNNESWTRDSIVDRSDDYLLDADCKRMSRIGSKKID